MKPQVSFVKWSNRSILLDDEPPTPHLIDENTEEHPYLPVLSNMRVSLLIYNINDYTLLPRANILTDWCSLFLVLLWTEQHGYMALHFLNHSSHTDGCPYL